MKPSEARVALVFLSLQFFAISATMLFSIGGLAELLKTERRILEEAN